MKTKILFLCTVVLILLALAASRLIKDKNYMGIVSPAIPTSSTFPMSPTSPQLQFTTPISLGNNKLLVAVADTDATRQQGLSGQDSLTNGQGMLFNFKNSKRRQPGFWMKQMKFDLDIIWIRDNVVVDITQNVPAPPSGAVPSGAAPGGLPLYYPSEPIDTVVEVPSGWCARHSITVGTRLAE